MSESLVFAPSAAAIARTRTTAAQYEEMYARSQSDPDGFWKDQSGRIDWISYNTCIRSPKVRGTSGRR